MALMTRDDYIESLQAMNKRVFIMGQEVEDLVDHPLVRPSLNACAMTYELAFALAAPVPGALENRGPDDLQTRPDPHSRSQPPSRGR